MLFLTASVLFMAVIAGERFFAIVFPLKARLTRPYQHVVVVVVTWTAAVLVALPELFVREMYQLFWLDHHEVWCSEEWPKYARMDQANSSHCLYDYPQRQIYYTFQVTNQL